MALAIKDKNSIIFPCTGKNNAVFLKFYKIKTLLNKSMIMVQKQGLLIFILLVVTATTQNKIFAQQKGKWLIKAGVSLSNQYYNMLPIPEAITYFDADFAIAGYETGYGTGSRNPRISNSLMVFYEKDYLSWLSASLGMGYRQRGYTYGYAVAQGIETSADIAVRLHYASSELAFRLKPFKNCWYVLVSNRFDILVAKRNSPEHQYIMDSMKAVEISPTVGLGREIKLGKLIGLIEVEYNYGLMNLTHFKAPNTIIRPKTKLWNASIGLNVGIKF